MTIAKNKQTTIPMITSLRVMAVSASIRATAHHCGLSQDDAEAKLRDAIGVTLREWAGVIAHGYTREQAKAVLTMLREAGARGWGMHSLFPGNAESLIWEMANSK